MDLPKYKIGMQVVYAIGDYKCLAVIRGGEKQPGEAWKYLIGYADTSGANWVLEANIIQVV